MLHCFFPTESKLWTDLNLHTVGDDLPGVPINSAQTGRRGRRPLQLKIIYKAIDATAFWIDSNRHTVGDDLPGVPINSALLSLLFFITGFAFVLQRCLQRMAPGNAHAPCISFSIVAGDSRIAR